MLKVSKARVYLHKLASAARMVQLSRMMKKVAENPPKPKGIDSGVDVSKGLNTASNSVNGQNVNAVPGGGGTLKNTTGPGNANSAVKGVGAGSPLNAARATFGATPESKSTVKPFFQNPVATSTLYDNRIDFWNQNTWVPNYNQYGIMVDADGKAAKKEQYPVTSYQDYAAANSGDGYVYDSANAASGFGLTNYTGNHTGNRDFAGYVNANENVIHFNPDQKSSTRPTVPHHEGTHLKTFVLDYMAGQPYPHMYNGLNAPERYGLAGNHSAIPGAVSDALRTALQQNQAPLDRGKGVILPDMQYGGMYRIPFSLNEAEAAATYAQIGYAQQNPYSGYYPAYGDILRVDPRLNPNAQIASLPPAPYKEPTQEARLLASLGGAGGASMLGGGGMMVTSGPELPSAEFTPATPLGYMLEANGTNSMGERYGVYGGPKKTKNGYEFNDNLLRMGYNVNDTQNAYTDAMMDPGSHFARLEALQHQFDPAYAQFRPIGVAPGSKEYQEMSQSPYTVQELLAMATSGSPELYEEASKYAHMLRPELRYLMQTNDAATMRAAYNDKDNESMNPIRSIMNADPRYMSAPQALQIPYSVTPGADKLTDHRSNATMDNMFDDIAYQNIRRDELLKEMNHSDTLDASGLFNPYYSPETSYGGSPYNLTPETTLAEFNKMRDEYANGRVNRAIARAEDEKGAPLTEEEKENIRQDYGPLPWFDTSKADERAYEEDTQALPAPSSVDDLEDDSEPQGSGNPGYYVDEGPTITDPSLSQQEMDPRIAERLNQLEGSIPSQVGNIPSQAGMFDTVSTMHPDFGEPRNMSFIEDEEEDVSPDMGATEPSRFDVSIPDLYQPPGTSSEAQDDMQMYEDFGVDPTVRYDGALTPSLQPPEERDFKYMGPTSSITDERQELGGYSTDDNWDSESESEFNSLDDYRRYLDSEGDDKWDDGIDSQLDELNKEIGSFGTPSQPVDRNRKERGGFRPKSDDYHGDEYMPWGQAAAEEREPSADEMMTLEEERIQREQDYPVPGKAESTDGQKPKQQGRFNNAFRHAKNEMQRMKEDAEKVQNDPNAEHIQNPDGSWTHSGTIRNGRVSNTGSRSRDLHAKSLPESSKSWTPSDGGYASNDGKTWTDAEIRSIGSPEEQFEVLSGDALERAMAMNMKSGFKSSGLMAKTVDYAMQQYDKLLSNAEAMGKLSSEHTARLRQRFRNYLWKIKPKQMYESNVARGLNTSKKHIAMLREWEKERARRRGDSATTPDDNWATHGDIEVGQFPYQYDNGIWDSDSQAPPPNNQVPVPRSIPWSGQVVAPSSEVASSGRARRMPPRSAY